MGCGGPTRKTLHLRPIVFAQHRYSYLWSGKINCQNPENTPRQVPHHISASGSCHQHYQEQTGIGCRISKQNLYDSRPHYHPAKFCLKNTYFLLQGTFYEQEEVAAMGSSINLITCTWRTLKECGEDMYMRLSLSRKQLTKSSRNTSAPSISASSLLQKRKDQMVPYILDTLVIPEPHITLSTTVYRKPTDTYKYLHRDINHNPTDKYSVFNTFTHGAGDYLS